MTGNPDAALSAAAVGWMVGSRESAALAEKLISETCAKQGIARGQLSLHADHGSSMTSKPVALPLADLAVIQSHSRPHVSNDNPCARVLTDSAASGGTWSAFVGLRPDAQPLP